MNREIRFRSYIKHSKTMVSWETMLSVDQIPETMGIFMDYFTEKDNCVLMQFTGILDEKLVEIYDKDIVITKDGITGIIKYEQQACQYWIKWKITDYNGKVIHRYRELTASSGGDKYYADYLEVIGNIYEHPHLLK